MFVLLYLLYFMDMFTRNVISPFFPVLKTELGLSDPQLGLLSSVVLGAVCILVFPLSYVVDRWRRGKLISLMAIIWSAATIFSGLSHNFGQLLTTRFALGVGEASFTSAGVAYLSSMFKKTKRTIMIGIFDTASPIGMGAGMAIGGILAASFDWRLVFIGMGIPGVILGILAWFAPDYESVKTAESQNIGNVKGLFQTLKQMATNKTMLAVCLAFGLSNIAQTSWITWLPSYFNRFMGMDLDKAGLIAGTVFLTALVATPVGGWISDRWAIKNPRGKLYLCFISSILSSVSMMLAFYCGSILLFYVGAGFNLLLLPSVQIVTQEVVPVSRKASAFGTLVLSQYLFGGLWGPLLTGLISDVTDLRIALIIVSLTPFFFAFIYLYGSQHYVKDSQDARDVEKLAESN